MTISESHSSHVFKLLFICHSYRTEMTFSVVGPEQEQSLIARDKKH